MGLDIERTDSPPATKGDKPHYFGHRRRMRERLLQSGAESLLDYEILEVLLFHAYPRVDVRADAKALIARFGGLNGVLYASREELADCIRPNDTLLCLLMALRDIARRMALEKVDERPVIASWESLIAYCRTTMANIRTEQLRLLFLDSKQRLILDELHQTGTIDHAPIYPREVIKRALMLNAAGLILVHNHPSGNPEPSPQDIEISCLIRDIAEKLGLQLQDHIIVARGGCASLRSRGLI